MATELPRIRKVSASPKFPNTLVIVWAGTERDAGRSDMTGVIASVKAFEPLRDPGLFRQVEIIDHGVAVGWPNGLDYSASNLRVLADEQQPMDGPAFARWQTRLKLSNREAADALGVSLKTVKNYRKSRRVPTAVTLACRAMQRDPLVMQAHYRPRRAGRPAKAMAGSLLGQTANTPRDAAGQPPKVEAGFSLGHRAKVPRDTAGRFLGKRPKASRGRDSA